MPEDKEKPKSRAFVYGGAPLSQKLEDARGTGYNDWVRFRNLRTNKGVEWGAGVERDLTPHITARLEGWRNAMDLPPQPEPTDYKRATNQPGLGKHSSQEVISISPSLNVGGDIAKGLRGYVGVGPTFNRVRQCDTSGCSPDSFDVGGQLYGGLRTNKLPFGLIAFIEGKYHRLNARPEDKLGAIENDFRDVSLFGGIGREW